MTETESVLARLIAVIEDRKIHMPQDSYTTRLLAGGVDKIGRKVIEEAGEFVEAAGESGEEGRDHFVHEAADLIYHVLVLLGHRDVKLAEVEAELARREGISGLEEKAEREEGRGGEDEGERG